LNSILFGLNVPTAVGRDNDPISLASRAEAAGFDFVSSNDHPCGTQPNHETWTLLAWIAATTSRVRVATRVLGVPYRPPSMVAKMAETLDRLSGGRLILGLGGGYSDDEFRAFGLNVPTPRQKIEGLEDAINITRGLWSESSFTYEGKRYRTVDADISPKPDHEIPLWLGTFGKRALDLTGRLADGWIPSLSEDAPPDMVPTMIGAIERGAESVGRDPGSIRRVYNLAINLNEQKDTDPYVVSGTPEEVIERLSQFVALGFDAFNFGVAGDGLDEQLDVLSRDVFPAIRKAG
jgi:alkanesulfonate monooxygenase SsuD/methylene tetrahydromethanopterin reductase-like flavin-dependent oxidoreductase (luciferase family)